MKNNFLFLNKQNRDTLSEIEGRHTMDKIKMTTPLVEMDGDEMTRILWKMIKDEDVYKRQL